MKPCSQRNPASNLEAIPLADDISDDKEEVFFFQTANLPQKYRLASSECQGKAWGR